MVGQIAVNLTVESAAKARAAALQERLPRGNNGDAAEGRWSRDGTAGLRTNRPQAHARRDRRPPRVAVFQMRFGQFGASFHSAIDDIQPIGNGGAG